MTLSQDNRFIGKEEKSQRRKKYLRDSLTANLSEQLFQYKTIKALLDSQTKSLRVTILQDKILKKGLAINSEWFFEMESLLHWLSEHLEVKSVSFAFDKGHTAFPYKQFQNLAEQEITLFYQRLRKLNKHIIELPQSTVFHYGEGVRGPWLELSLSFDIRVSTPGAYFCWDHLSWGLYPASGVLALSELEGIGQKLKLWLISGCNITSEQALRYGLVSELTYDSSDLENLLQRINNQSSFSRIQLKKGLSEKRKALLDQTALHDHACLKGALESGDWQKSLHFSSEKKNHGPKFANPQTLKIELAEKGIL